MKRNVSKKSAISLTNYKLMETNNSKGIVKLVVGGLIGLTLLITAFVFMGHNDTQDWQVVQYPNGTVEVRDSAGYYLTWGAKVTTYPKNWQVEYNNKWAFPVVFNDSGVGTMNTLVRFSSPLTKDAKLELHNQFGGKIGRAHV